MIDLVELRDEDTNEPVFINEGESHNVVGQFVDANGDDITLANLSTFTVTLYNEANDSVINSRNAQNAKNANDHTVAGDGSWIVRLQPADNIIVDTDLTKNKDEYHILRLIWTWNDGTADRTGIKHVRFPVRKQASVS